MRSRASITASPFLCGLVLCVGIGAGLAACASRSPMAATAEIELRKKEIQDYWIQIRDWRVDHGWSAEPVIRVPGASVREIRRCKAPRAPSTDTCQDICTLKDAICDNAQSICRIAGELEGDAWADEKCKSAKASCKEATEKCCQCTDAEQSSATPPALGREK
jgi:hypothetical protein